MPETLEKQPFFKSDKLTEPQDMQLKKEQPDSTGSIGNLKDLDRITEPIQKIKISRQETKD